MRYVYKHDMYHEKELRPKVRILSINGMGGSGVERYKEESAAAA